MARWGKGPSYFIILSEDEKCIEAYKLWRSSQIGFKRFLRECGRRSKKGRHNGDDRLLVDGVIAVPGYQRIVAVARISYLNRLASKKNKRKRKKIDGEKQGGQVVVSARPGPPPKTIVLSMKLPKHLADTAAKYAKKAGSTFSDIVREAIELYAAGCCNGIDVYHDDNIHLQRSVRIDIETYKVLKSLGEKCGTGMSHIVRCSLARLLGIV